MNGSFPLNGSSAVHIMMTFLSICTHEFVENHGKERGKKKKKKREREISASIEACKDVSSISPLINLFIYPNLSSVSLYNNF